jgi:hypothetical protein
VAFEEDYYDYIAKEMSGEKKYKPAGRERYPSNLHEAEVEALETVVEMARGNMNCSRTDERMDALKLVEKMIKACGS